jgi:hypothetical protein
MTEDVVPFARPPVQQLTLEEFKRLSAEEKERAQRDGHLAELLKHGPKWKPPTENK